MRAWDTAEAVSIVGHFREVTSAKTPGSLLGEAGHLSLVPLEMGPTSKNLSEKRL